jgi:hypothetical protein
LSRRWFLGAAGGVGLAAAGAGGVVALNGDDEAQQKGAARVTAPPPEGVLGANFNGDPSGMGFAELREVSATWLRGFFPVTDAAPGALANQPAVRTLLTAAGQGYGTVLSLKFPSGARKYCDDGRARTLGQGAADRPGPDRHPDDRQ